MRALGVLAATVHVVDPIECAPRVLLAGEQVTDSALVEQITNPRCWEGRQSPFLDVAPRKSARKAKSA